MKHTVSLEKLYHFNCGKCKKWWSIGDWLPNSLHVLTCPHCKETLEVEDYAKR